MIIRKYLLLILSVFCNPITSLASHKTKILFVSAEKSGVFQTGGLAHAVGGLATAFEQEGIVADVAMPFYLKMNKPPQFSYPDVHIEVPLDVDHEGHSHRSAEFFVLKSGVPNHGETIYFRHSLSKQNYFDNRSDQGRKTYGPEAIMGEAFGAWSKAVTEYILSQNYDIVMLNDWHSSLVALFLDIAKRQGRKVPKVVLAIHNLAYQGVYPKSLMYTLGIPQEYYSIEDGIEFHNQISYLKAGILKSDLVYTVSPNYASEIATPLFGAGLDGLIRRAVSENRLAGILNGIDNSKWDPSTKYHEVIRWTFTESDFTGKEQGKAALQEDWKLPVDAKTPIFVMSSRVVEQKGYEYLPKAMEIFLENHQAQFIVIGDGDKAYTDKLKALQERFPTQFRFSKFAEEHEKALKAYGDFFINAAWFEPSGLNQFFALKNGTIPILSRVGGLSNSIEDGISGFLFDIIWKDDRSGYDVKATTGVLVRAFERAVDVYEKQPEKIIAMRRAGMKIDNSWSSRVKNEFTSLFHDRLAIPLKTIQFCQKALDQSH